MWLFRLVTAIVLLFPETGFAMANLFEYALPAYPRDGVACRDVANALGGALAREAGVEIYAAESHAESAASCDIKLTYLAQTPLAKESSVERSLVAPPYQAAYGTRADCEQALDAEKKLFERATGLRPWVAYCQLETPLGRAAFSAHVDGIGSPRQRFFATVDTQLERPLVGWESAFRMIREGAARTGFALASVSLIQTGASPEILLRGYAPTRRWARNHSHASVETPSACERQLERTRARLLNALRPPLAVFCSRYWHEDYRLHWIALHEGPLGENGIAAVVDPKSHPTWEICLTHVEETERFYREKLGRPVLAGACGGRNARFQVTLFEDVPRRQRRSKPLSAGARSNCSTCRTTVAGGRSGAGGPVSAATAAAPASTSSVRTRSAPEAPAPTTPRPDAVLPARPGQS